MKKLLYTATIGLVAAFSLSACGTSAAPAPTVTVTEQPAPVVPDTTPEDEYLANMHSQNNMYTESLPDSKLLELGYQACDVFAQGYTAEEFIYTMATGSFGQQYGDDPQALSFVGNIIGASVVSLCPEYLYLAQDLVNG